MTLDLLFGEIKHNYVAKFLVTSYAYYYLNFSIISDEEFDEICQYIHFNFDEIEHPHKYLLDKESLKAGTGYHIKENQFPTIVKNTAKMLIKERD